MTARIALLFSGQGSQHVGMAAWLFSDSAVARDTLSEAEEILGYPLGRLLRSGPESELRQTRYAQPALLTVCVAVHRALRDSRQPAFCAGHSVGEYSALVAAGCLSFQDALRLVALRGNLMQTAVPAGTGGMLAVLGAPLPLLHEHCRSAERDGVLDISAFNCPGQVVVSGTKDALRRLRARLGRRNIPTAMLRVSVPFHCRLLRVVEAPLREHLCRTPLQRPRVPVLSNRDGRALRTQRSLPIRLAEQAWRPVLWEQCLRTLDRHNVEAVVEVGPGRALLGHMRRTAPRVRRYATDTREGFEKVRRWLAS